VQALEQPLDQRRTLDEITHEHEQRDRDQHVVRHHAVGALHEQVEHRARADLEGLVAVGKPGEEHAHPHQGEGSGKAEHDRDHHQGKHQQPEVAVGEMQPRCEHQHRQQDQRHDAEAEHHFLAHLHQRRSA